MEWNGMEDLERAMELLKKHEVRWVHSTFVDIRGLMQDVVIPTKQYVEGRALTAGIGFDGSCMHALTSTPFCPKLKALFEA